MANLQVNNPTDSARRTRDAEEQLDRMVRLGREVKTIVSPRAPAQHGERSPKKTKVDASHGTASRE